MNGAVATAGAETARGAIATDDGRDDRAAAELASLLRPRHRCFLRGHELVRVGRVADLDPRRAEIRDAAAPIVLPVTEAWLGLEAAGVADFLRGDKLVSPPARIVRGVIETADELGFPPLRGVAPGPILRPDGSVTARRGYDPGSGLWIEPGFSERALSVPAHPDRDDAEAAGRELSELFRNFDFVDEVALAVAISAILTTLLRPLLPAAPAHAFDAPAPGSGKSLLADAVARIATGRRGAVLSAPQNLEELEKRLDGALLAADPVVVLDNVSRPLEGDKLAQLVSEPTINVRRLQFTGNQRVPNTVALLVTGNNLGARADMCRRVLVCRIDPQTDRPELRRFSQDLIAEVSEARPSLIAAAFTIARAHRLAGAGMVASPPLGGFERWDCAVRQPLIWAGFADPMASMEGLRAEDPERELLEALHQSWDRAFGGIGVTVKEVLERAEHVEPLLEAVRPLASSGGALSSRRLAKFLQRHKDQRVNGRFLRKVGDRQGTALWALMGR